ncbi:MAG: site-specific integrase, partial [Thermomicrobiales bacterium]
TPTAPEKIAEYFAATAETYAVATLQRRLAAISKAHRAIGADDPCRSEIVQAVMRGVRRSRGVAQRQAQALLRDDLFVVLDRLEYRPKDIRDRALLLLGWATAMRRSELVALDVEDVEFTTKGALITVRRSKTDQEGRGREIAVPLGRTRHCPIAALKEWLVFAEIETGAIFTTVNKHGHLLKSRMSGEAASNVVKARVAYAGYDPAAFSGHSLRAGFVTAAALAGASTYKIRETTGHRSESGLAPYLRTVSLFDDAAVAKLL